MIPHAGASLQAGRAAFRPDSAPEGGSRLFLYYLALVPIVVIALYTAVYASKTWQLRNRRGAVGLLLLDGALVVLAWWVLFGQR